MKNNFSKSIVAITFISLFLTLIALVQTNVVYGATDVLKFEPQIAMPGMGSQPIAVGNEVDGVMTSDLLAKYIKAIYDYGLAIAGILAAVVLMGAGLLWLTSGGNESKVTQAKDLITGSITGLIILFGAWMLLNTVNPELLKLRPLRVMTVDITYGCCDKAKASGRAEMTSNQNCEEGSNFSTLKQLSINGTCEPQACCVITAKTTNSGYETTATDICVNTLSQTCDRIEKVKNSNPPAYTRYTSKMESGGCEDIPKCSQQILSCAGKSDAFSGDAGNGQTYWCYGKVFYFGQGDVGEPCGNERYSKCTTEYLSNAADYLKRDCCDGLTAGCTRSWCNKFKADGTKKYDQDIQ